MNGCWIKLKLKETRGDARGAPGVLAREKIAIRGDRQNFLWVLPIRVRESEREKIPRNKYKKLWMCGMHYGCIRRMLVLLFVAPAEKNSCTHKLRGGVRNIYKFLPILNANFMLFSCPRDVRKKWNFCSQFVLLTTTPKQRDWIENRTSTRYTRSAHREPTTIGIFVYVQLHAHIS